MSSWKRSRALWARVVAQHPTQNYYDSTYFVNLPQALLYEIQPIRSSLVMEYGYNLVQQYTTTSFSHFSFQSCVEVISKVLFVSIPNAIVPVSHWLRYRTTMYHWFGLIGIIVYYYFIRWIHAWIEAGPMVVIVTALIAIFTIGLSDHPNGEISAYSVFNQGFQQLLGSIDTDSLLQQHVGGGMIMNMPNNRRMDPNNEVNHDNDNPIRHRRRYDNNDNFDREVAPARPDRLVPRDNNNNNNNHNRARRSNKKIRRRDPEQRRELQQQRQAAAAMGFGGDHDQNALYRLMEEDDDDDNNINDHHRIPLERQDE